MTSKEPTYEEAMEQLESIITSIEEGKIGLEKIVEECEKGATLLRRCRSILTEAEARIQKLQLAEDGGLTPVPMEPPADTDEERDVVF
jgi:exodeoxyribonuclease VII small subunit